MGVWLERRHGSRWCARVKQQVTEQVEMLTSKLKSKPVLQQQVHELLTQEHDDSATPGASH